MWPLIGRKTIIKLIDQKSNFDHYFSKKKEAEGQTVNWGQNQPNLMSA